MDACRLDPRRTALLCMDFQAGIVQNFAGEDAAGLLERAAALLEAARNAKAKVGYVKVGFRPGYPEVSPNNQSFSSIRSSGRFEGDAPGTEIHPRVAPREGEFVVTKHRVGAFHGTDLDMILRANGSTRWYSPGSPPAAWCSRPCAMRPTRTTASWWWPTAAATPTRKCIAC